MLIIFMIVVHCYRSSSETQFGTRLGGYSTKWPCGNKTVHGPRGTYNQEQLVALGPVYTERQRQRSQCCNDACDTAHWKQWKQESPPAWTQEAYRPPRSRCLLCWCVCVWGGGGLAHPVMVRGGVPHPVMVGGGTLGNPPTIQIWLGYPPTPTIQTWR